MRVLITGSDGFIGGLCRSRLQEAGVKSEGYDLPHDVTDLSELTAFTTGWRQGTSCLHLAAHKHAPYGEECPAEVAQTNIVGTHNVVKLFGPDVVLASTCKAADPMTAYGASKLIAERIVLNAGGKVVRLVNVWGSSGSVADTWDQIPENDPLPVASDCRRMWMSHGDAVQLLTAALTWPSGRYAPTPGDPVSMVDHTARVYPYRAMTLISPRRGDRPTERLVAEYEWSEPWSEGVQRIFHPADLPVETARAAL